MKNISSWIAREYVLLVQLADGNLEDGQYSAVSKPVSLVLHDLLSRRKALQYKPIKPKSDNGEPPTPLPTSKTGGDDDFPSAAGAAEKVRVLERRTPKL